MCFTDSTVDCLCWVRWLGTGAVKDVTQPGSMSADKTAQVLIDRGIDRDVEEVVEEDIVMFLQLFQLLVWLLSMIMTMAMGGGVS